MRLPKRKPGKYSFEKADLNFTSEKVSVLRAELNKLKNNDQPQAAKEVARLGALGDFSENAAYQMAKGKLRSINSRIIQLENKVNGAVIINPAINSSTVELGSLVTIEMSGKEITYQILGSGETDPMRGIISHNSPIGSVLMGHKVGDTPICKIRDEEIKCKIIRIQ